LFRISQTEQKLKKEDIKTEGEANKTHYRVGKIVRGAIKKLEEKCQKNYLLQVKV